MWEFSLMGEAVGLLTERGVGVLRTILFKSYKGLSKSIWDLNNISIYSVAQSTCLLPETKVNVSRTLHRILNDQEKPHRFSVFVTQEAWQFMREKVKVDFTSYVFPD